MTIKSDRERLLQKHKLDWIRRDLKATEMVTVCRWNSENVKMDYFILGGLIPSNKVDEVLSEQHISGVIENVWPEPTAYRSDRESPVKYFRWGVDEDIYGSEPLVIGRQFSKMKENYFEISEEFRLFHNLYHDRKTDTYIKIDDAGNEETVVVVKSDEVQIRLKEIRQFLAIKEMYLSMLFEFNEYSTYSLQELGLSDVEWTFERDGLIFWRHDYSGDTHYHKEGFQSDSRLRGRRLIAPVPKSKSGLGDFAEEPKYAEFIVDVDQNGDEVYHTYDPHELRDVSDENPNTPQGFTSVHFRKQDEEWANSDQPDLLFKQNYRELQRVCDEYLGWQILKPPKPGDEDRLRNLRVSDPNDESSFKGWILDLAVLLVELLNERHLKSLIPDGERNKVKGEKKPYSINRLEYLLDSRGVVEVANQINFLRSLWDLRNTYSKAHVENTDDDRYKRAAAYFDFENLNYQEKCVKILIEAVQFLDFLIAVVRSGKLSGKNSEST